jgi:hypothetical protein
MNTDKRTGKWIFLLLLIAAIAGCIYVMSIMDANSGPLFHYGIRIVIVALALTGWFLSQALIGSRSLESGEITDGIHELSAPLHGYLLNNPKIADRILIVSSGFIDLFGLFLIAISIFGHTMKPFLALLILFIFRQICQALCALPAPRNMIWRHPGFPSLLVTYGTATDFFFSGHTAIAVLGAIEVARIGPWWLAIAAGVIAFLEASVVLILRAHYTMDIFGAIVAAFCALNLADLICAAF